MQKIKGLYLALGAGTIVALGLGYGVFQKKMAPEVQQNTSRNQNYQTSATNVEKENIPQKSERQSVQVIQGDVYVPEKIPTYWQTYKNSEYEVKYPNGWFVEIGELSGQTYFRTTQKPIEKKEILPLDFQMVWISNSDQNQKDFRKREDEIKNGDTTYKTILSPITTSVIIATNNTSIRTYEYLTVGGATIEAYWEDALGNVYYAHNSVGLGEAIQKNEVVSLKKILSTFRFLSKEKI